MSSKALLSGIRVVDFTRILAGPFVTMILGDMGADVIKIEKPVEGDETRSWGPPFCGMESAYFLSVNRNKRSIAVDLKKSEGVKLAANLVRASDIVVENFIPGKIDSMGLGYDNLKDSNPGLIFCSISGFGPTGPYSKRPGFDVIASSYGGLNYITGPESGEPCKVGVAITDLCTGLYAHGAILAALFQREKTGLGQKIDCDLLSCQIATLVNVSSNYLNSGMEAKRWGTAHPSIVPYQSFKTKDDRYITVGATNNRLFEDLCHKIGLADLIEDERFTSNENRVIHREILITILKKRFLTKTCEEWLKIFEKSSCPHGPVNNMEQVFSDPHVKYNKLVVEYDHPTAGPGRKVTAPPVKYSDYSYPTMRPPPTLGQHTHEVLDDVLGMNNAAIENLFEQGVVA